MDDAIDWRTTLQSDYRQRIINKTMETLERHLPITGPERLVEIRRIATKFEERVYTASKSQSDYLGIISRKMLYLETKSQPTGMANTVQSNSAGSAQNPPDSASHSMQSHVNNQGQSQIPLPNQSQAQQQLLSQNVQNTPVNTGVQCSANLPSALPSVTSLTQTSTPNAAGHSTKMQSGIEKNSVGSSVSQGLASDIFSNSQYLYQQRQHLQHQMLSSSIDSTAQTGQDAIDWRWRSTLQPDSRQKQLNRILETLKNCFLICGSVGLVELNKMAEWFEEEIYTAVTSHSDYLHKIYLRILKMETRFQTDATHSMQSQLRNQGQSQIPLRNQSQARQQLLPQNTIVNAGVQSSASLTEIRCNR